MTDSESTRNDGKPEGFPSRQASGSTSPDPTSADLEKRIEGKGWLRWILLAVVTVAVFVLLGTGLDYSEVWSVLKDADPVLLGVGVLLTATFPVFSALRWQRMLRGLGYELGLGRAVQLIMAAWPMGTLTPSKAGDVVKAYFLKDEIPVRTVLGSVVAERALDVLVLLGMALFGCVLFQRWELAALAGAGFVFGIGVLFLLLRARLPIPAKIGQKLEPVLDAVRATLSSPGLLAQIVFWTVCNWMASVVQVVVCYKALGVDVPLLMTTGAVPLAIFVGLLPVTLSGMGTRDSAFIFLFQAYAPAEVSLGVGLLYSLYGYWLPAVVGLPFMRAVLPRGSRPRRSQAD